jgi:translation elongation factor EF-Tu-like GTPase
MVRQRVDGPHGILMSEHSGNPAMEKGVRFAIRWGGRTVGVSFVLKIIN